MNHRLLLLIIVILLTGCGCSCNEEHKTNPKPLFETIDDPADYLPPLYRTRTPDGWLVYLGSRPCYVPDTYKRWIPDAASVASSTEVEKQ